MLIQFTENCGLNAQDKELVLAWPALHERLKQSETSSPFSTSRVDIRGAAIIGRGADRKVFMVDVRVFFSRKDDVREHSYHLSIQPSASCLLLMYQDAGENSALVPPATADNLYLVVVEQDRWVADAINSPEPPGGQSEEGETPREAAWREAKEEIGEELFDHLCCAYSPRPLNVHDTVRFYPTIAADTTLSASYEAFASIVPVTSNQLESIRAKVGKGSMKGLEGEDTRPVLISLSAAIDEAKLAIIAYVIIEFLRIFGIAVPAKKHTAPLPYVDLFK